MIVWVRLVFRKIAAEMFFTASDLGADPLSGAYFVVVCQAQLEQVPIMSLRPLRRPWKTLCSRLGHLPPWKP